MEFDKDFNTSLYLENLVIISNYIELGTRTISRIAGNDISTRVDNDTLSNSIRSLLASKLNQELLRYN